MFILKQNKYIAPPAPPALRSRNNQPSDSRSRYVRKQQFPFQTIANWLTISDEIEIRKCCLIYKRIDGLTPDYIDDILVRNADLHLRTTRHSNVNLVCPRYKRAGADLEVSRINQIQNLKFKIPVNNNPIGQVFVRNYS